MKKAKLLAPRNAAREVLSDTDAQRMLDSGSWVIATIPRKRTAGARNQQNYMRRKLDAGHRMLHTLLPDHVFNELHARLHAGESMASLLERLLSESVADNGENQLVHTNKVDSSQC